MAHRFDRAVAERKIAHTTRLPRRKRSKTERLTLRAFTARMLNTNGETPGNHPLEKRLTI
jgi:hypothetical protein